MSIFQQTSRPSVSFRRGDPNDIRLGEVVKNSPEDYAAAPVVLLGFPQDEGVQRNKGRVGAKDAPDAIRACLYKLVQLEGLFDLGNTLIQATLEESHALHQSVVEQVLREGKTLIVLGGGNDTSYPDCAALARVFPQIAGLNIDAHLDVRADSPPNSGTPYRQLLEEKHLDAPHFHELGYQPFANSPTYLNYLREKGANLYSLPQIQAQGWENVLGKVLQQSEKRHLFWGLDMDVVQAGDAPGVSAPNPAGLSAAAVCQLAQTAGRQPLSRIFEITEVNPHYDIDERTCRLAAVLIWYFMQERLNYV